MEAIGTMKVTRTGDVVSNVPSSSNQMAERGELFSYEQSHKTLQREGHNVTYDVDYDYIGSGTNHLSCELELEEEVIGGRVEFEEPETKHFADGFHEGRWEDDVRIVDDAGVDIKTGKAAFPGIDAIQKQAYNEMTADGLPPGGDRQAVIDSHRLAEEIVDNKDEKWIYESPDGGKTVFRRPFGDLDMKNKVEIDWETKEPTGRVFTDYPFEEKGNEG